MGRTTVVAVKTPLRISKKYRRKQKCEHYSCYLDGYNNTKSTIMILGIFTRLDSSGEARLNNSTLTFTNKGPENTNIIFIQQYSKFYASSAHYFSHINIRAYTKYLYYLCEWDVYWPTAI